MRRLLRHSPYDVVSLVIITLCLLLALVNPMLTLRIYEDHTFHVLIAQQFDRIDGITTHNFWESLPAGRPNNYPPLYHIALSGLVALDLHPYSVIRVAAFLLCALLLIGYWFFIRALLGRQTALWALIILACNLQWFMISVATAPANLVYLAGLAMLWFIQRRAWKAVWALAVLSLYTHMFMPWMIACALLGWIWIAHRDLLRPFAITWFWATLTASPWLGWVLYSRHAVKYFDSATSEGTVQLPMFINYLWLTGLLVAILYLQRTWKKNKHDVIWFFIFFALVSVPVIFSRYPNRFWSSLGYTSLTVVIAWAFESCLRRGKYVKQCVGIASIVVAILLWTLPTIMVSPGQRVTAYSEQGLAAFAWEWIVARDTSIRHNQFQFFSPAVLRIADTMRQQSIAGESVLVYATTMGPIVRTETLRYSFSRLFAVLSERLSANLSMPEVFYKPLMPMSFARFVVVSVDQVRGDSSLAQRLAASFELMAQEGQLQVYRNTAERVFTATTSRPVLPRIIAYALIVGLLLVVVQEARRVKAL